MQLQSVNFCYPKVESSWLKEAYIGKSEQEYLLKKENTD